MRKVAAAFLVLLLLFLGASSGQKPSAPPRSAELLRILDQAALDFLRQSPETVTLRGLALQLGMRNDALDGVALDPTGEAYAPFEAALETIEAADVASLPESDQRAVTAFATWLRDIVEGREYQAYACPVSTYLTSVPQYLAWFMESVHPLRTSEDAADYLSRLSQIPSRFSDLKERLDAVEEAGALPPRPLLLRAADQIDALGRVSAEASPFARRFAAALGDMSELDEDARQELLARAFQLLSDEVLPAYVDLAEAVRGFANRASDDVGIWRLPGGRAYYQYLLRVYTTTDMTAEEIYALGLREVARLQADVRGAAARRGYDVSMPLAALFAEIRDDAGVVSGSAAVAACEDLVASATNLVQGAFLDWPDMPLTVEPGGSIAYFVEGTDDGTRPGVFFVPVDQVRPMYSLKSLVYHETIPGHFLQMATARDASLPSFLGSVSFAGYTEGWATYAERLAWELGAYDDDPLGNIGRLQEELFRAARLVVDPGIHALQWSYEQAVQYMMDATGLSEATVRDEVDRYVVQPGQATAYGVGLYKLLELRDHARAALGARFDVAEFLSLIHI